METIYAYAQRIKDTYISGRNVEIEEGLYFDMRDHLKEINYMVSGHYLTGDEDENGELKPFHDIIHRILENQQSAEELDTKNMELATNHPEYYVRVSFLSKFNQDWMRESNFAERLNKMIETRGMSGGVLVKKIEHDDHFEVEVIPWRSFSGDPLDLQDGVRVINNEYSPARLLEVADERGWDRDMAIEAIDLYAEANENEEMMEQRETVGDKVLVREVSGVLPRTFIDEEADEHEYSYQMHYIAGSEFRDEEGIDKGVTLMSMELDESPFKYLPYKVRAEDPNILGIGMVDRARHAQIWTNYAAQQHKYAMDYASLPLLQSSSQNLKGKNVFTELPRGSIMFHEQGEPMTNVSLAPTSLGVADDMIALWQNQVNQATGTHAIGTGDVEQLPADLTLGLGAILDQNGQSSFDKRREEMAIFINELYREWVLPWMIKQVKKRKELILEFSPEELKQYDRDAAQYEADKEIRAKYFAGGYNDLPATMRMAVMDAEREAMITQGVKSLQRGKSRRKISEFPDGYWDDVLDKMFVNIVGEHTNKSARLAAVSNIMMEYLQVLPYLQSDPNVRKLFAQKVEMAGLDPLDLNQPIAPQLQAQVDAPAPTELPTEPEPAAVSAKPE